MDAQDLAVWATFFSALVGFNAHPGNKHVKSYVDLAAEADMMFQQYKLRKCGEVEPWAL